jgi:hypothetical protein
MHRMLAFAVTVLVALHAVACSGRTDTNEPRATTTSGTCGCCGQVVDIGSNQHCSDPGVCAEACAAADAASDAPRDAPADAGSE